MNLLDRPLKVGLISASDRASAGVYPDQGLPSLKTWLDGALLTPCEYVERLIPDQQAVIEAALIDLVDQQRCDLVLTTGGTGPALRDVTPEATRAIAHKEMPGFGEQMRQISLHFVATAILSRQTAVIRFHPAGQHGAGGADSAHSAHNAAVNTTGPIAGNTSGALIINLPGQPKAIRETLEGLRGKDGALIAGGIFAAVPYCIDLIGGPYIETDAAVCQAFRPKTAVRERSTLTLKRKPA